ncbi:hypothetical protein FHW37_102403 [Neorhizobium alkalisoli]|uniref:Uncharacterized protein n=2 Tax=Neorhizobium alkalisoli TaxID=528178 RepID=A0A561R2D6_9HYPH|nr:hypothetical protein FHW37_102403 [Neorhizobium alkalisoli]
MAKGAYYFECMSKNIHKGDVHNIIKKAGENQSNPEVYDPNLYIYEEASTKRVIAKGPGDMAINPLEFAGSQLGFKGLSVMWVAGKVAAATSSDGPADRSFGPLEPTMGNLLGATSYGVAIQMTDATVTALSNGNYLLYGFKGVQANMGGGRPLVWFKSADYGTETDVSWEIQYQAYTSRSEIIPNGQIKGLTPYNINLGQKLKVQTPQGSGNVVEGDPGNISILNLTTDQMTCGISEVVEGTAQPLCAFPLYGNGLDAMVPIQKVLLTFSTKVVNTGTVIEQAYSQSILIDLTSSTHRAVSFDINKGWSWGGYSWAQKVEADSNVVPLLIDAA